MANMGTTNPKIGTKTSNPLDGVVLRSVCGLPEGAMMRVVEYFSGPPAKPGDHKCTNGKCSLKGWLYLPKDAAAGRKAVVYLHGHHKQRQEPCAIASYFLSQNYVVFAPLRNGNIAEDNSRPPREEFRSTGEYIDDWATIPNGDEEARRVQYLRDFQTETVRLALSYVANLRDRDGNKLVGEGRIGMLGHSYGGSLAVFSAGGGFGVNPRAIADVSGAELSWQSDGPWATAMQAAVQNRKIPIYFLQPRNGKSTQPTIVLSGVAATSGDTEFEAALFPDAAGKDHDAVHGNFVETTESVNQWGPSVRDFFERYFDPVSDKEAKKAS